MRIDHLELENFKNYEHLELDFVPGINLFVGSNGSGKTSILEAVNIAVAGFFGSRESKMQRVIAFDEIRIAGGQKVSSATVRAYSEIVNGEWSRTIRRDTRANDVKHLRAVIEYGKHIFECFETDDNKTIAPLIVYYSTQRLFKDAKITEKQKYDAEAGRRNGYLQCLKEDAIKGVLNDWLGKAVIRRATKHIKEIKSTDKVLENVEQAIRQCLIHFLDLPHDFSLKIYQEPDFDNELFINYDDEHNLPLSNYSDGFRNIIYLIIDMVWRASQLNPWLNLTDLSAQINGVVTIDEVDLHLHPKWQAKVISFLQQLLPNVQFFITTHSPTIVANFHERQDSEEEKIDTLYMLADNSVRRISSSFYGQDINSILDNPMDAAPRAKKVLDLLKEFDAIAGNPDSQDADYERLLQIAAELNDILPGTDEAIIKVNEIAERVRNSQ
ncbi:AAA family ATPase [Chitinophaga agri]|uniref:AAA family ATPase n=1 Tax=Chitinophaga agri TaxID=2703787 RepID=A0A6B9ZHR3_9BACT|nr:AAA family ATPase [Chitinophaga agri]QHS61031.1 AAA family ATPase [Chitinophaga agri]